MKALASGRCDAIFMWWDLQMDTEGKIMLSCAPRWAHPTPKNMQWRDHWMQAIYYPQQHLTVKEGEEFCVISNHDEYSLWFDVTEANCENEAAKKPAVCTCGAHLSFSRTRLGMLNDTKKNDKYIQALQKIITKDSICINVGSGSLLPIMAAKMGAKKVYTIETERMTSAVIESYVKHNNLSDTIKILDKAAEHITEEDLDNNKITAIIGEPYFQNSILPWHNILFWYTRTELAPHLAEDYKVMPCCATMKAIAVEFKDLYKIRAPVGDCEGFNLHTFDKLIESSSEIADAYVEPQPLWEYPSTPLTEQVGLLHFDFTKPLTGLRTVNRQGYINFHNSGICNGVAVWMEFHHGNKTVITTGLVTPPKAGETLQWEENSRQGVHLLKTPIKVDVTNGAIMRLRYKVTFRPQNGDIDFVFSVTR
jgi:protein arginine N-methyltransferase 7